MKTIVRVKHVNIEYGKEEEKATMETHVFISRVCRNSLRDKDSLKTYIPKEVVEFLNLGPYSVLVWYIKDGKIVVEKLV